ncbi:MAG: SDR family oxidoreductase [Elusimicrobia bacterium]|nr:SDR family oxidoreductase [Elusimicrobiota bacterium]
MAVTPSSFRSDLLAGKCAVVTGGGTGIGRAVAEDLLRHGARVVIASRNLERLEETARELSSLGEISALACDIADDRQVKTMAAAAQERMGRVDLLINNAAANFIRPSEMLTPVRWRKIVDIVLNGTFYCSLEFGRRMLEQGSGRIVSIVAAYAWTGAPGLLPSAAAKAGVVAMTRTLGAEWAARGVLVNAISPGPIDVPQTREHLWPTPEMQAKVLSSIPLDRFGSEQDVSSLVLFLASDLGRNIAGEVIVSDGGQSLGRGALDMLSALRAVRAKPKGA